MPMSDIGNTTTPDYQRWLDSQPPYYADDYFMTNIPDKEEWHEDAEECEDGGLPPVR